MSEMTFPFRIGDRVQWTSQSAGSGPVTKVGVVVEVLAAGVRPGAIAQCGQARDHESYVVRASVVRTNDKVMGMPRRYWPLVGKLQRA